VTQRNIIRKCVAGIASFVSVGLIVALNTLVLFAVANIGAALYLSRGQPVVSSEDARRAQADSVIAKYGIDFFKRLYANKTEAQIRELIYDQPVTGTTYEPFAEFRTTAYTSTTFSIHQAGFRFNGAGQGPWPLDNKALNIFVFGSSTTVGSGVEDEKTIPAALQSILREKVAISGLPVNVYNFGVAAFFSSQEVIYFQNQLRYGHLPDMVVFIDGLTDFHYWDGDTANSKNLRHTFDLIQSLNKRIGREQGVTWHFVELWKSLPIVQLVMKLAVKSGDRLVQYKGPGWISETQAAPLRPLRQGDGPNQPERRFGLTLAGGGASADEIYSRTYSDGLEITDPVRIQAIIARYLTNKDIAQAIANQFGIEAIFAWQPGPLYNYNLAVHPFKIEDEHRRHRYGYPAMARYVKTRDMGTNFVWCADVLSNSDHSLYVDQVHYNEDANRLIAGCIANTVLASGAIDRILQRKLGQVAAVAARRDFSVPVDGLEIATKTIASVFGSQASVSNIVLSKPLSEWSDISSSGVRLEDASADYAVIYQYVPIERGPGERTYQVSVRIKPATSDYLGLVLLCVGSAKPENEVMFVNPKTMGVISANGLHEVRDESGGWTRLTLTGTCKAPDNDRLQVLLYPAHGAAENRGAILFGGGEVRRVVTASQPPSEEGPRQ